MDPRTIRAFVERERTLVDTAKQEHHARRFRESSGLAGFRVAQALWTYARRVRPDWPTVHDRDEDLAHHVTLKRRLERAAHAFARR